MKTIKKPYNSSLRDTIKKCLSFASNYKYFVFINGNGFSNGFPTQFAFSNSKTTFNLDQVNLEDLDTSSPSSSFGYLTYDLKNNIENLESQNKDNINFDPIFFINPEVIIELENDNISFSSNDLESTLSIWENTADFNTTRIKELTFSASINKETYIKKVKEIQNQIKQGNVYEMNFCMEYHTTSEEFDPLSAYLLLNEISPTPFSCLVKNDKQWLISASPERFLKKVNDKIISQPIKGTSKRFEDPIADLQSKNELINSEKEKAENLMIVDLVRNDLARVSIPGTINVEELFGIYSFKQVHQMISTVTAKISPTKTFSDIIKATFPMGSMTGAPKISSMELIEKYEENKRGLYSGSVGYINKNGDFDFNVVIRSLLYNAKDNNLSFQVGSAITIDSDPEKEYEECLLKAKALNQCFCK